jgi:hypothetical protein
MVYDHFMRRYVIFLLLFFIRSNARVLSPNPRLVHHRGQATRRRLRPFPPRATDTAEIASWLESHQTDNQSKNYQVSSARKQIRIAPNTAKALKCDDFTSYRTTNPRQ